MERLILKNFRCFRDVNVRLAPVTLLIGENSTGKTSFLAGVRLAWDAIFSDGNPVRLDEEPYSLGRASEIVLRKEDYYTLGLVDELVGWLGGESVRMQIEASFEAQQTGGVASGLRLLFPDATDLDFKRDENASQWRFRLTERDRSDPVGGPVTIPESWLSGGRALSYDVAVGMAPMPDMSPMFDDDGRPRHPWTRIADYRPKTPRPYAFAPVRSDLERTFSYGDVIPSADGSHVPQMLARVLGTGDSSGVDDELSRFGKDSTLFQRVTAKHLGGGVAFQLRIKLGISQERNIIDVGYGVGQVLPVLTEVIMNPAKTFLIQQPEVHLHPRAQAAFGSFAGRVAKTRGKQLIIETHSDYILDRLCMDLRDKVNGLTPDDVNILYFERNKKGDVEVHEIGLDESGNLTNVPKGYREFFMTEEKRFLFGNG